MSLPVNEDRKVTISGHSYKQTANTQGFHSPSYDLLQRPRKRNLIKHCSLSAFQGQLWVGIDGNAKGSVYRQYCMRPPASLFMHSIVNLKRDLRLHHGRSIVMTTRAFAASLDTPCAAFTKMMSSRQCIFPAHIRCANHVVLPRICSRDTPPLVTL